MSTIQHSAVTGADLHGIVAFSVASVAARNALTVVAGDIGKVAQVTADNSFYVLTSVSPSVWTQMGSTFTLPVATASVLGGVKQGTNITIAGDGTISAAATGASLSAANTWTAGQRGAVTVLTAGATVTPDFAVSNNFSLTANQNFTLANPSNLVAGQSGIVAITQDATGGRVISWGTYFKAAGGTKPVLTTTANAVDYISYYVESATRIFVSITSDVK